MATIFFICKWWRISSCHLQREQYETVTLEGWSKKFKIGNPLDASILDRRCSLRTHSNELILGQVSLYKGNTWCEAERSRHFGVAEQTVQAKLMSSSMEVIDMNEGHKLPHHIHN